MEALAVVDPAPSDIGSRTAGILGDVQGIWTLAIDESGQFEAASAGEESSAKHVLLGAVLCPGDAAALDARWTGLMKRTCRELGVSYPPHATELDEDAREVLVRAASADVAALVGQWIFLVHALEGRDKRDIVLYARMLGELIDVAARLLVRNGGHKLDVRPAQRSVPLLIEEALRAEQLGLERGERTDDGRFRVRTTAEAEVRQALEALAREPQGALPKPPQLNSVEALTAAGRTAHAGVHLADAGCNRMFRALRQRPPVEHEDLVAMFSPAHVVMLGRHAARRLRALGRSLRSTPPDLVSAARELERTTTKDREDHVAVQTASRVALAELWSSSIARLEPHADHAVARALFSMSDMHLATKSGSYEGVWRALEDAWVGSGALAARMRQAVSDRELAARLWRVTLECANHRGDVESAERAEREFASLLQRGHSLVLLAEWSMVSNLAAVRLQNELPATPEAHDALVQKLRDNIVSLVAAADVAGDIVALGMSAPPVRATVPDDADEQRLWAALGRAPTWTAPDRERGRSYGTAARTHAFLGELDSARELCLRARGFFADSPFDLRFNASVLARIELERARLAPLGPPSPILDAAMRLAGGGELDDPGSVAAMVSKQPATRFALDLVLRRMLWTREDDRRRDSWLRALRKEGDQSLFHALAASELRTHPTELIARHAGELLGDEPAAQRWFELSLAVSGAAPSGTIRRFGDFTRRLPRLASGPHGCLTNPSFEYR